MRRRRQQDLQQGCDGRASRASAKFCEGTATTFRSCLLCMFFLQRQIATLMCNFFYLAGKRSQTDREWSWDYKNSCTMPPLPNWGTRVRAAKDFSLFPLQFLCSLFIFAKVDSSLLVEMVLPIFEDLRVSFRGETVELQYPRPQQPSCIFEFPVEQAQTAVNVLSNAVEDASK